MSVALCVVFQASVPPYDTLGADHIDILRVWNKLNARAEANGLVPLGRFESYDPEGFDYPDMDQEQARSLPDPAPEEWFSPSEGLAAVRALLAFLEAHPDALRDPGPVVADLKEIESELERAARRGVPFHFSVVP